MDENIRVGTGIEGLDRAIDCLRSGDTVLWQIEHISDYIFAATQFVANIARDGKRIVYLRFGGHEEVIDAQALAERGANVRRCDLDPGVGFETFAVQVHRIIASEGEGVFYIFDCLTELQKYWFSDMMVCNFFCLTCPFLREQQSIAYVPIMYEKHIYETVSRIRHAAPVLMNIRTLNAATYIHAVKVEGRRSERMYFPIKIDGSGCSSVTSSAESFGIFDIFTQTGERRDCWDSMFDFAGQGGAEGAAGGELHDNIIRCLLGNEPQRFELCRKYFSTEHLIRIKKREIGTGCIGGKAVGMLLARRVLEATDPELYARRIEPHDSYFIGADVFYTYFVQNDAWSLRTRMVDVEDYLSVAPLIREKLLGGKFMHSIKEQFRSMLEYFGQSPIIVRSSSILEDGFGNAFAGKYDSVFCPNQGTPEERYAEFEAAVKTVYASTVNEDAIRYRADRGLLSRDEQMALLVMRVSGDIHGDYYYPHVAGVGHSRNLYMTSAEAEANNRGMLRLVFGMGTRAVDREADDYARLLDMARPLAPPKVAYGDEYRFSQHKLDAINLRTNRFETVEIASIDKADLKTDPFLFMEPDGATRARWREMGVDYPVPDIVNFDRLLRRTDFCAVMTKLMRDLEEHYSYPVDVEFACNFLPDREYRINLLQCRPLQTRGIGQQGVKPMVKDYFFRISGNFMGGNICLPVRYIVRVDVDAYLDLPEQKKYHVARSIGKLNALLAGEHTVLMGPGRWGTTTPSLGVPVNYTEVSKFDCMCELAYSSHGLRPELSYGSHFFQDLVEAGTFYTAIYRGESGCEFNDALFEQYDNRYRELLGDAAEDDMEKVVRVYDTEGRAILYSEIASQECFLARI